MNIYEIYSSSSGELPFNMDIRDIKRFNIYWSKTIEFIFIVSGSSHIYMDDQVYNLKEGDLFLVNKNKIYRLVRPEDSATVVLKFSMTKDCYSDFIGEMDKLIFDSQKFFKSGSRLDYLKYHIAAIVYELDLLDPGYEFRILGSLNLFLGHLLRFFDYSLDKNTSLEDKANMDRLESLIEYVDENYYRKITLNEMSEQLHLSYYYLSHFLKDSLGISFKQYVDAVRVEKSIDLLLKRGANISDIAYQVGFSSPGSYNRAFKNLYDLSPSQYREMNYKFKVNEEEGLDRLSINRKKLKSICLHYLSLFNREVDLKEMIDSVRIDLDLALKKENQSLNKYWNNLICLGRGSEYLRNSFEKQLKMVQKEISFKNVKVNGVYLTHSEFTSLKEKTDFSSYDWTYVNKLFDILLNNGLNPYVELSHVSGTSGNYVPEGWWEEIVPPPSDFDSWMNILDSLMRNIINRYGIKEIEKWYFEIWNEARLNYMIWDLEPEDYFDYYEIMARRIKSFSPNIRVGGLGLTYNGKEDMDYIEAFLSHCRKNKIPVDFISLKMYPEHVEAGPREESIRALKDENFILESLEELESFKDEYGIDLYITEWSTSISFENPIHNKTYAASYILDQLSKCYGKTDTMGYWIMSDLVENYSFNEFLDSGGYGLLTRDGIKKPSYYAYYLLDKLGDEVLSRGDGYIVTRTGENLQILLFNHSYGKMENGESIFFKLNISNIDGKFKETVYTLDKENGSAYDQWIKLGKTIDLSKEELDYIRRLSVPRINIGERIFESSYNDNIEIPANGIKLIVLERRY